MCRGYGIVSLLRAFVCMAFVMTPWQQQCVFILGEKKIMKTFLASTFLIQINKHRRKLVCRRRASSHMIWCQCWARVWRQQTLSSKKKKKMKIVTFFGSYWDVDGKGFVSSLNKWRWWKRYEHGKLNFIIKRRVILVMYLIWHHQGCHRQILSPSSPLIPMVNR